MGTFLNETTYMLVDELEIIAKAHDSTVARVARAWVRTRPGVSSTIIGARRLSQLEDNLKSLDLMLTAAELANLDSLTKPTFGFPQTMQPLFPAIHNGGTMVNGVHAPTDRTNPGWRECLRGAQALVSRVYRSVSMTTDFAGKSTLSTPPET
jgi:hypothetical protein